jgi:hypothetical protein
LFLQALDDMVDNPFASQLAAKLRVRFATTADGIRCEAAAILTKEGHEEYYRYVVSWASEDPSLSDELRAAAEFAQKYRDIREKITGDAVVLLPGADPEAIGAAFDAFLRQESFWLPGESSVFGWKRFRAESSDDGPKFLATLAIIYAEMPPGGLQLNDFFHFSRGMEPVRDQGSG